VAFHFARRPLRPAAGATIVRRSRRRLLRHPLSTLLAVLLATILASACNSLPQIAGLSATPTPTVRPRDRPTPTPLPLIQNSGPVVEPRSQTYVTGVSFPVGMTFAPDGRLFFNEAKNGVMRIAEPNNGLGRILAQPFVQLETAKGAETGMLGIALHPDFAQNHWVYLYYTEPDPDRKERVPLRNRVVRFTERDNVGTDMTVILDDIAVSRQGVHNGGVLRFGPDGKLYVTVGNAQDQRQIPGHSQNLTTLNGKVLRLNDDGTIPNDNPFPGSAIFAYGFRNPFGMTFDATTGLPWVTENSGDNNDEINRVEAGGNYGFPHYEGVGNDDQYIDPIWSSGDLTIGPTGLTFYTGDQIPQYRGDLFFCAVNTGSLTRLRLSADHRTVEGGEEAAKNCHLDVINGPDGALYYSTFTQIMRLGR
jgi:glucose/arabinose dehydrogenase